MEQTQLIYAIAGFLIAAMMRVIAKMIDRFILQRHQDDEQSLSRSLQGIREELVSLRIAMGASQSSCIERHSNINSKFKDHHDRIKTLEVTTERHTVDIATIKNTLE